MTPDKLLAWWNVIYLLPLALVLVVLTITSLVGLAGGALDAAGGHDAAGADLGAHGGASGHADIGHASTDLHVDGSGLHADAGGADAGTDADVPDDIGAHGHDADADGGSLLLAALTFLGAGTAPLMLVIQLLLLLWGSVGILLHLLAGAQSAFALVWSAPVSGIVSVIGTRTFARFFGRFVSEEHSSARRRSQLVGHAGRVVYTVTTDAGTIHVRDDRSTLHRVRARTQGPALPAGAEVVVVDYDDRTGLYVVADIDRYLHAVVAPEGVEQQTPHAGEPRPANAEATPAAVPSAPRDSSSG
jgi:membrane protein implicated in regulation of membrane protease activity